MLASSQDEDDPKRDSFSKLNHRYTVAPIDRTVETMCHCSIVSEMDATILNRCKEEEGDRLYRISLKTNKEDCQSLKFILFKKKKEIFK